MSVFALGLNAILSDSSFGEDAFRKAGGSGPGVLVRIVRRALNQVERFGDSRALLGSVSAFSWRLRNQPEQAPAMRRQTPCTIASLT